MRTTKAMFLLLLITAHCFLPGCGTGDNDLHTALTGNWLITAPDHQLTTYRQRQVYKKCQDSIVNLYGLKLITLAADGGFTETDSLLRPQGNWLFTKDSLLKIKEGGKGFNPFSTRVLKAVNGELQLQQLLNIDNQEVELIWQLKKIKKDDEATALYTPEANSWRRKPVTPETDDAIKKRVAGILNFYGGYFKLVSTEASYFLPKKVPLPLKYYQHAIGVTDTVSAQFNVFFYDEGDAAKAHVIIRETVRALKGDFPRDKNFGLEYGAFLKKMAARLQN